MSSVHGAVDLLWSGNWRICQAAVETVLHDRTLRPIPKLLSSIAFPPISSDESTETDDGSCTFDWRNNSSLLAKRKKYGGECSIDLDLSLNTGIFTDDAEAAMKKGKSRRPGTPSRNSKDSVAMSACFESG